MNPAEPGVPIESGLLVEVRPDRVRTAVVEAGALVELLIDTVARPSRVGEVHRARVARVDRAIGGCFLALSGGEAGFLGLESGGEGLTEGDTVVAQVIRDPAQGKAVGLRRRVELGGALVLLALNAPGEIAVTRRVRAPAERERLRALLAVAARPGEAWTARTAAAAATPDAVRSEMAALRGLADGLVASGPPAILHREPGPVEQAIRAVAHTDPAVILVDDGAAYTAARSFVERALPGLAGRMRHHRGGPVLAGVAAEIAVALQRRVDLDNGSVLWIDRARALTAIDLDLGRAGERGLGAVEANLAAVPAIARQLRLRGIGGSIVVDFLRMPERAQRDALADAMRRAVASDRLPVQVLGFTRGGLLELTRPHGRPELRTLLTRDCAACDGAGWTILEDEEA